MMRAILGAVKHIVIIFVFENDKWNKLSAGVKGLRDGFCIAWNRERGM
jgi:rhamnosyltransferase